MKPTFCTLTVVGVAVWAVAGTPLRAASRETATLVSACEVVDAMAAMPEKGIPPAMLKDAQAVVIIPHVVKAGFVLGGRYGRGVFLARGPGESWTRPTFVCLTGGSIGWQAGVQSTDLVLLFRTRSSVERFLKGKGKITLGGDVAVAAGPVGRQAEAATDAQLKAEIYSYSRSRGLFAGLSLEGAAILVDNRATDDYYRSLAHPPGGMIPLTPPDAALQLRLTSLGAHFLPPPVITTPPVPVPPPY
jgi:lipid-binding SYLF domain-containing protein